MTVGERIKMVRIEKGYTQDSLAKKMGYSGKTSISKIESSGDSITLNTVTKFANALGVNESILMGWDDVDWNPETQEIYIEDNDYSKYQSFLNTNPEYKVLFDASQRVNPKNIEKALKALELFMD